MSADDLLATFISRRVLPLQRRVHKICHMSGPLDNAQIRKRIKAIARTKMPEEWEWGKEPYNRNNLPPKVSTSTDITFHESATLSFCTDYLPNPLCRDSDDNRRRTDRTPPPTGVKTGSKPTWKIPTTMITCRFPTSAQFLPRVRLVLPPSEIGPRTKTTTVNF